MLNVAEEIKELCRKNNSSPDTWRGITFSFFTSGIDTLYPSNDLYPESNLYPSDAGEPWKVITDREISSENMVLKENLCSAEDLIWGSCEAAQMEFTAVDAGEEIEGKEFVAVLSVGVHKLAFGMYTVASSVREADRKKWKVTAYDRMIRFDIDVADWYQALYSEDGAVYTIREIRKSLCEYCNVPQEDVTLTNDALVVGKTIDPQTLKGRDVLRMLCEINGVFGHIDRTGMLVYVKLQESGLYPSEDLYPDTKLYPISSWAQAEEAPFYKSLTYEDYVVNGIDRVQIRQEEGDIGATAGSGANTYIIEGNMFTFGFGSAELVKIAQAVVNEIGGREYRPLKLETFAMPWVEVGDGIRAVTSDGEEVSTYVLSRTLKGIQAMMDTYESKGSKEQKENFNIRSEIIQLKGRSAVIVKSIEEVSVKVTDLEKNTSAKLKVVSDAITAEVTRAKDSEATLNIRADQITQSVKNLKDDTEAQFKITSNQITSSVTDLEKNVNTKISQLSDQIELKVSSSDLIASINLGLTKTGSVITMNAGHFEFKGQNFYVNLDGSGGAASGNLTWDKDGRLSLKGANIEGALVTSTSSSSVISAATMLASGFVANDSFSVNCYADMADIGANTISCAKIYANNLKDDCYTFSDRRLKDDIRNIPLEDARCILNELRPVSFLFKKDKEKSMGLIAQEVEDIEKRHGYLYPLFKVDEKGWYTIPYKNFIPLIVRVVQEQQREIDKLKEARQ